MMYTYESAQCTVSFGTPCIITLLPIYMMKQTEDLFCLVVQLMTLVSKRLNFKDFNHTIQSVDLGHIVLCCWLQVAKCMSIYYIIALLIA